MNIESASVRIMDVLNLPLMHRCPELGLIIDRASIKDLQEIFPNVINHIFGGAAGGIGWGFRTITQALNPHEFEILYNFFIPLGPMFRLLYRLLNDSVKYDVPVSFLPPKMQQMLEAGRYSSFYSDIINIDPFRRQIVSLSLNAFDYFFIHFVIHGTLPLHKMYSQAMQVNSDKSRTVYFFLTADYLCTFLPSHPDSVVQPQNICGTVKTTAVTPAPQPMRRPKYLLLSALSPTQPQSTPTRHTESSRALIWRSETVLFLFIDGWLRWDFDESRDLPSNEFIRVVRTLVKQLHGFGNSAERDNTPLVVLRQIAQPLMSAKMYGFLKSLLQRWPLDSSFTDVLELWLSFIQPWRYTFNRDLTRMAELPIPPKHEAFIRDNLVSYTQIFVKVSPRFERLDLSTLKNVFMLFRIIKVFSQSNLADILRYLESTNPTMDTSFGNSLSFGSPNRSGGDLSGEWRPFSRNDNLQLEDSHTNLFTGDFLYKVEQLARKVMVSRILARRNLAEMEAERERKYRGFIGWLKSIFFGDEDAAFSSALADRRKIPEILDFCVQGIKLIFGIEVPEPLLDQIESFGDDGSFDMTDYSEFSDKFSPSFMRQNLKNLKFGGDPALIPINDTREVSFLVRFFHQLSLKLNLMFEQEIEEYWNRMDFKGRITRHLLLPPKLSSTFDKSTGNSELVYKDLPPRICLRVLASYKAICLITGAFLLGYLVWGAPSYGLFVLFLLTAFTIVFKALLFSVSVDPVD